MNEEAVLAQLKQDLPYMFGRSHYCCYHRGWVAVFDTLCRNIDAVLGTDNRAFRWTTVKEKYGSARFYFELDHLRELMVDLHHGSRVVSLRMGGSQDADDEVRNSIIGLINEAQRATETRCAVCAAVGHVTRQEGWLICVCEMHSQFSAGSIREASYLLEI